jgi:hypothetical protein
MLNLFDPQERLAHRHHRRLRHHRHAHRRRHRARRQAPGAQEFENPGPHGRARHRVLERAPARFDLPLRRDPRAFAPARKPQRLRRRLEKDLGKKITVTDDWESCVRGADIVVEASRLEKPDAHAQDRVDQERRLRHSLRHHERGGAVAHRHHGQDGDGRLGPGQGGAAGRAARPRGQRQAVGNNAARRAGPDRRRASSPGARATTRPTCSGTAACRCRTSRWAPSCCEKAKRIGLGQSCVSAERPACRSPTPTPACTPPRRPARRTGIACCAGRWSAPACPGTWSTTTRRRRCRCCGRATTWAWR